MFVHCVPSICFCGVYVVKPGVIRLKFEGIYHLLNSNESQNSVIYNCETMIVMSFQILHPIVVWYFKGLLLAFCSVRLCYSG